MCTPRNKLKELIDASLGFCRNWLSIDNQGGLRLLDPLDNRIINAHYGDSHLAAALIILGQMRGDHGLIKTGVKIISTVLRDWESAVKLDDFHHDFNNFALCLIEDKLRDSEPGICRHIRNVVLRTPDSNHSTINWLPMRAYVNRTRYSWTNKSRYLEIYNQCIINIKLATNDDGGIDDRLPAGVSYNLQYNVSTLAGLLVLWRKWPETAFDIDRSRSFLLAHILPDGDINYVGRGTNQIFAWGAWLYVLASVKSREPLHKALLFLGKRYPQAGKNQNIFLNDFWGGEKLFWWDYHYCSVYHAHFLLWSTLALHDYEAETPNEINSMPNSTGLSISNGEFGGVVVFEGRKKYLAESGPAVCAIWISEKDVIFKGGRGPWQGSFGKRYSYADVVFMNHFGLVSQRITRLLPDIRIIEKMYRWSSEDNGAIIRPVFSDIKVEHGSDYIRIAFKGNKQSGYLNTPMLDPSAPGIRIEHSVDGKELRSVCLGKIKNQYGWVNVVRSEASQGRNWLVEIRRS